MSKDDTTERMSRDPYDLSTPDERCGCPPEDRNLPGELRAWLMTYTGYNVSRRDAENLINFLKKSGWKEPTL